MRYTSPMRTIKFVSGEHYHIYNRGNNKQLIFRDDRDRARFLLLILCLQSDQSFSNISRIVSFFLKNNILNIDISGIIKKRTIALENFALMPNHFHLLLYQKRTQGISQYMQRVLTAYTKYFNTRYASVGHLFQGPFQAIPVASNEQLLHLSAYIHRNPREINQWRKKEHTFPWSSFQDYVGSNRWGKLLSRDIVLKQFASKRDYFEFVSTSGTKLLNEDLMIDNQMFKARF